MRATFTFLWGCLLAASSYGQMGQVDFSNTSTTLLKTNTCAEISFPAVTGPISGANAYRIGLYIAPFGTTDDSQFALVALATNGLFAGRFDGGNASLPPLGSPIGFQIRAWSLFAGSSYEAALQYPSTPGPTVYVGKSARGFVVPLVPGGPTLPFPPFLMGEGYGQVPGFELFPRCICLTCPAPLPSSNTVPVSITTSMNGGHTVSWRTNAATYLLEWAPTVPGSNQWQAIITGVNYSSGRLSYSTSTNSSARFYRLRRL